jgi:uncharacterized protein (TIGR03435 family)
MRALTAALFIAVALFAQEKPTFEVASIRPSSPTLPAVPFRITFDHGTFTASNFSKKDGKLGAGLVESKEGSCVAADANSVPAPPEPGKPATPLCRSTRMSSRLLRSFDLPLEEFAHSLSQILGRQVVDQTGLIGNFNINLEWTPNESQALQLPPGVQAPPPPDSPVSIFTATQEQLGLKLESKKGPVEVWVIDRAEKPSEN